MASNSVRVAVLGAAARTLKEILFPRFASRELKLPI